MQEQTITDLKILFVIDSLGTGGAERDLAEKLPQLGRFKVTPIVVSLPRREEGVQVDLQRQGFDVRILNTSGLIGRLAALRKILRTERPDVIQTVETESLIQKDLRQKGHQLYLESAAQVSHLNFERVSSFICVKYLSGRVFGAARHGVRPSCTVCCMPVAPR